MSRPKLTIVVTCTDRKTVPPAPDLQVRSLARATLSERADDWADRLSRTRPHTPLMDLYMGDAWTQSKRLLRIAADVGFEPRLFVASAGLGLRSVDELAPSYSATFSRGNPDTVARTADEARTWWNRLPHSTVDLSRASPSIWVLSETYAQALAKEIGALDHNETLVFGGADSTPRSIRVPSDRHLRSALGGTLTTLNTRMAIRWLEIAGSVDISTASTRRSWDQWARGARLVESFNRKAATDDSVRDFIRDLEGQDGLSKSAALRTLRASGIACEQRRFSALFDEVHQR